MFKKGILISLSFILVILLIGCGKDNKLKTVSNKDIEPGVGTKESKEKVSKSNDTIKYEFETENYNVVVTTKYNSKKFKYKDGKFETEHYNIYMEFVEYDYNRYDLYKDLDGYEKMTIGGMEALRTMGDIGDLIMVKISDEDILSITGETDGKIMVVEMIEDKYYKEIVDNVKIEVTKK